MSELDLAHLDPQLADRHPQVTGQRVLELEVTVLPERTASPP